MKKILIIFTVLVLAINLASAFQIASGSYADSAQLEKVVQTNFIEGNELYADTYIQGIGDINYFNDTNAYFSLRLEPFEREKAFILYDVNVIAYEGICYSGTDYKSLYFNCNKTILIEQNISSTEIYVKINLTILNKSNPRFSIKIKYKLKDFVFQNGDYNIAWMKNNCGNCELQRFLVLPNQNSVIESLYNFQVVSRINNNWVLETNNGEDAMVWYRDINKEFWERTKRDIIIIALTFSISLIFGFLFSNSKLSKRTKHLWSLAGACLFITTGILLYDLANVAKFLHLSQGIVAIILMIFYFLFFIFLLLALSSGKKDEPKETLLKGLKRIWRFVVSIFKDC
jgi:hypothetical protein